MPQAARSATIFRFGPFEFDHDAGELRKHGLKLRVVGQPLEVLALLFEHPGEVVLREELQKRLWSADTFVEFEHGVNAAVKRLREALGDSADQPRYVETIPRRGYRFIAPVTRVPKESGSISLRNDIDQPAIAKAEVPHIPFSFRRKYAFRWLLAVAFLGVGAAILYWIYGSTGRLRPTHSASARITSIAVLPLTNLSGDSEQEYFADGVTDELITQLSNVRGLKVISRTSTMRYKGTKKLLPEIGRELGVDAIIEGTVVRSGNRIRISAQLIDVSSDTHLWSETYERDLENILALQAEVTLAISKHISVTVTNEQKKEPDSARAVNPKAYEFYLKGRHHLWRREVGWAAENFSRAIELDAHYAEAYAGLAETYAIFEPQNFPGIPRKLADKAKSTAYQALQLDSTLPQPHAALGWVKFVYDWDWAGAEEEFKLAKELNPNYETAPFWYAVELIWEGKFEQGLAEMRRARELAPASPLISAFSGMAFYQARKYQEAIRQLQEAIQLDTTQSAPHLWLGLTYLSLGIQDKAIAELEKGAELSRSRQIRVTAALSRLGYGYGVIGRHKQAEAIIRELMEISKSQYVSPLHIAIVYLGLGNKDQALIWLKKGFEDRSYEMAVLKVDPRFDSLRSEPRFQDLLRGMHFPD
jgi:TolB-like protein/DNA-binding winged helix-turn-helix (wHTH) protein